VNLQLDHFSEEEKEKEFVYKFFFLCILKNFFKTFSGGTGKRSATQPTPTHKI